MELITESKTSIILSLVILVTLIGLICHSCVDAIVKTVETEEEQRIFRVEKETPKAYRMTSPTPEQMDKYHDLLTVMEVKNAKQE